jgi:hypothetical protein
MIWPGTEPELQSWESGDCLCYDMAKANLEHSTADLR